MLLVHGFMANRGSLHLLKGRLAARGYEVFSFDLGRLNFGDLRLCAEGIAEKVQTLRQQTGVAHVDYVGHSMGGLAGLYGTKLFPEAMAVRKLVLLGSPVRGSWAAALGLVSVPLGPASKQLLPGSAFLKDLHARPLPPGVEITSIAGERDRLATLDRSLLEGVRHVTLPTTHSGLLVDPRVVDTLDGILGAKFDRERGPGLVEDGEPQ